VKVRKICKFLKEGHRVKISLRFKGREMIYKEHGKKILERATNEIGEVGKAETSPSISHRVVEQYLVPKLDK